MRAIILVAGAALALSACGGGNSEANEVDTLSADNLIVDDANALGMDANAPLNGLDANGMEVSGTTDPATQNALEQDLNTNSPDTNLANGL